MCGRDIAQGILCDKCDRPKRTSGSKGTAAQALHDDAHEHEHHAEASPDPFPKAPVVPFPVESTSLALTSIVELLAAIDLPSILLGSDRSVKFVSDPAKKLLKVSDGINQRTLEMTLGIALPEPNNSYTTTLGINDSPVEFRSIPLAGGASGSVLLFKPPVAASADDLDAAVLEFVAETLLAPLQALRGALSSAQNRGSREPIVHEAIGTIDQVLSSLELSPHLDGILQKAPAAPLIADVLKKAAARFEKQAAAKSIKIQLDAPETTERFTDAAELERTLGYLLENSLHYVPAHGQVVLGMRFLEHKGKPLILFFVMDNGAVVPEEFREAIFSPGFVWDPNDATRTGNNLAKCRNFAVAHGGQIWVESKTGKACTFFIRVRPDG